MIIIEDLGYFKLTPKSKQKAHYVVASCEKCGAIKTTKLQQAQNAQGCKKCFSGGANASHRQSNTKLYKRYHKIIERCNNKNNKDYKDYGARGITVCDAWSNDFMIFHKWAYDNGYFEGTKLTVERKDNNKGYNPQNCKFATRYEQSGNTRIRKNCKQGLIGVNKNPLNNKWYATVVHNKKRVQFGGFLTSKEGVEVRNNYIIQHSLRSPLN